MMKKPDLIKFETLCSLLKNGSKIRAKNLQVHPIQTVLVAGAVIELGEITYSSPRDGATVWEIGVPDRTANGFFVPDANPKYVNRLFLNHPEK